MTGTTRKRSLGMRATSADQGSSALTVESVDFAFANRVGRRPSSPIKRVFDGLSFSVETSGVLAILGQSGVGKSTLLRLLAALETPSSGSIEILGRSPEGLRSSRELGFVPQSRTLLPWKSVEKNLLFLQPGKTPDQAIVSIARALGLDQLLDRRSNEISGGQAARVALARAILRKPVVLLLDEPFASIDPMAKETLWHIMREYRDKIPLTVVTTHDIREALTVADTIVVLKPLDCGSKVCVVSNAPMEPSAFVLTDGERRLRGMLAG